MALKTFPRMQIKTRWKKVVLHDLLCLLLISCFSATLRIITPAWCSRMWIRHFFYCDVSIQFFPNCKQTSRVKKCRDQTIFSSQTISLVGFEWFGDRMRRELLACRGNTCSRMLFGDAKPFKSKSSKNPSFPSSCGYAHFGILHWKILMEMSK